MPFRNRQGALASSGLYDEQLAMSAIMPSNQGKASARTHLEAYRDRVCMTIRTPKIIWWGASITYGARLLTIFTLGGFDHYISEPAA